jgi:hypothetical protein
MRIAPLAVCLLSLATPAAASGADWWWTQTAPGSRLMVERGSIARNGVWTTAWLQDFFVSPKGVNQFSVRYLIQHDCARGETMVLSAQAFDGDGQPLVAPITDRSPSRLADGLREICADDWSGATRVQDLDSEVRMWRLAHDN